MTKYTRPTQQLQLRHGGRTDLAGSKSHCGNAVCKGSAVQLTDNLTELRVGAAAEKYLR